MYISVDDVMSCRVNDSVLRYYKWRFIDNYLNSDKEIVLVYDREQYGDANLVSQYLPRGYRRVHILNYGIEYNKQLASISNYYIIALPNWESDRHLTDSQREQLGCILPEAGKRGKPLGDNVKRLSNGFKSILYPSRFVPESYSVWCKRNAMSAIFSNQKFYQSYHKKVKLEVLRILLNIINNQ